MAYESVNPYNGKTLRTFPELTDKQLEAKPATAAHTFESWKQTSYAERALIVARAAELMHANVDKFAGHATVEMGKLINDSRGEVKYSTDILDLLRDER